MLTRFAKRLPYSVRLFSVQQKEANKHAYWKEDRSDQLKYSFLDNQPTFKEIEDQLHPDLMKALQANNFTYMTNIQKLVSNNVDKMYRQLTMEYWKEKT